MRTTGAVRSEEIRALFEQGSPVLWANVSVGAVVAGTLWGRVPSGRIIIWYAALVVMCVVRALFQRRFRLEQPDASELPAWGRRFVFGTTVAGALWGSAALLFFTHADLLAQALLTFAIGGMTAAAAGTLSCHLPAFFAFFVPALAPLALRALAEGDRFHYGMAAMLTAYAVGMRRVALNNHRAYTRALHLGAANSDLLAALSASEVELRDANRTLEQRVLERTKTLEEQAEALRRAQRLEIAGRLAGSLAHDFNSLLTVVINNASHLQQSQTLDQHDHLAASEVLEAGRRGAALIRQLLALSRRQRADARAFSLNDLASEWAELLRRILGEGVELELSLHDGPTRVEADPGYVEQVLLKLVLSTSTARNGSGKLRLSTEQEPNGGALLCIAHTPSSDDPEPGQAHNPYLAFDTDLRSRRLGLSSVWATAEQWGGRVSVDEGSGAAHYRVSFPASADAPSSSKVDRTPPIVSPNNATVLVVDDEPTLRAVMRRALTRKGYAVLVAEDGERALTLAREHQGPIDLLLTDVVMPGLSGLQLARLMAADWPDLAVLYVSGFTFEEEVPPTDVARGIAYLPKPFDTDVLTDKVAELLSALRTGKSIEASG
jgi:CheY-like chemotaxis protein/signal transduction histidine kinase